MSRGIHRVLQSILLVLRAALENGMIIGVLLFADLILWDFAWADGGCPQLLHANWVEQGSLGRPEYPACLKNVWSLSILMIAVAMTTR